MGFFTQHSKMKFKTKHGKIQSILFFHYEEEKDPKAKRMATDIGNTETSHRQLQRNYRDDPAS